MRQEKNGIRYFSFQEMPDMPKHEKTTYGDKKREKFLGVCKICKAPLSYVSGTNVIVCTNEKCRGIQIKKKGDEGEIKNLPIFRLLDEKGMNKAEALFKNE